MLLCVVAMELDEMVVVLVAVPKGLKILLWSGHRGGAGAGAYDKHKHIEGCLVDQEAPNMEAWPSRRPLTINFKILIC